MCLKIKEEINDYWTNRVQGYNDVNQDELSGVQHNAWQKEISKAIMNAFPGSMNNDIRILDIGTGPGFFAIILAELGYDITGIDANYEMLRQARKNASIRNLDIKFESMDAQSLDFPSEAFDVIVSRNLTWVLPEPERAYQEWCRVLKPEGLIINFDANWYNYLYDSDLREAFENDRANVAGKGLEDHYLTTDMDTMERIARQVPLSSVKRPFWDIDILTRLNMQNISVDDTIGDRVLSETEKINYASTPYFMITARKN